ncbi:MAG: tetratricopeptide repeat protein, partial [Planctomycetota bacterium]
MTHLDTDRSGRTAGQTAIRIFCLAVALTLASSARADEALLLADGRTVVCDVVVEHAGVLEVVDGQGIALSISETEIRTRAPLTVATARSMLGAWYGSPEAQTRLGLAFATGNGVLPNHRAAAWLFHKAASRGHTRGMSHWAWALEKGLGTQVDMPAARAWYGLAAADGNPFASARVAALAAAKDPHGRVLALYREADRQGDSRATYFVARCLELGLDVRRDRVVARSIWHRGAISGEPGCMLQYGLSLLRNPTSLDEVLAGRNWVRKAAARGDRLAMYTLGRVHHRGELRFPRDRATAERWLRASASAGAHQAMAELGRLLWSRNQPEEARTWLARAVNLGNQSAAPQLGNMFEYGQGGPKTPALAAALYRAAAENGDPAAIKGIVRLLESGRSKPLNRQELGHWRYKLSAAKHIEDGLRGRPTEKPAPPGATPLWLTTALTLREHLISISMCLGILFMLHSLRNPRRVVPHDI